MSASRRILPPWFWPVCVLALGLRLIAVILRREELNHDIDMYLGIARGLWNGVGFCTPESSSPTAFRPPLYPLLLAVTYGPLGNVGTALLQITAGTLCVAATMLAGQRLLTGRLPALAGLLVAVDPLLLRYTPLPMTEVTSAALCAGLLWVWPDAASSARKCVQEALPSHAGTGKTVDRGSNGGEIPQKWSAQRTLKWAHQLTVLSYPRIWASGVLLAANVLCRPSLLPVPVVIAGLQVLNELRTGLRFPEGIIRGMARLLLPAVAICGIAGVLLLPWGLRNLWVLGHFKVTTTHGGYTLLLGNNPVFYEAVVNQPWGTTWGDYGADDPLSQAVWYRNLVAELNDRGLTTEFSQDAAQFEMAKQHIQADPVSFLKACRLRFVRLWSPLPIGPDSAGVPRVILFGLWLFYGGVYVAAAWGLISAGRRRETLGPWLPTLALVLTLTIVHLFFWTNARMRAPLMPAVALLASAGMICRNK